jgi:hypothetical protein
VIQGVGQLRLVHDHEEPLRGGRDHLLAGVSGPAALDQVPVGDLIRAVDGEVDLPDVL